MADLSVFRGNSPARIDDRGRLKVPGDFRGPLESRYGRELFVTSLTGEYVRIYPMPVWVEIEQKLGAMPTTHPSRVRFLERANYFGQAGEIDAQGRVLLPVRLRVAADMTGEVDVLGQVNWLEVWNHDRLVARFQSEPYSENDARALSEYGI